MDPTIAGLGIAAAVALAQNYQAEKARGAASDKLKAMEKEFAALIPPNYDVSITDPPKFIEQSVPPTAFNAQNMTPEQYKVAAKYKPEIAPFVAEKNPELVKQSGAATEGRQAQMDALRKMRGIASSDFDPGLADKLSQASRQAQIDAQSRGQSILSQMQRRGAANSGLAMMGQQQAGADAMDREAQMGQAGAAEAYQNKINAIRSSAQMGGDIAGAENSLAAQNASIINNYNQRFTKAQQDWQNSRAGDMNSANQINMQNEQNVANGNTDVNNRFALSNQARQDKIAQSLHDSQVSNRDYQNSIAERKANWAQGQKEYLNTLRGKTFDDKYRIAAGKQGLATQGMQMDYQNAQDKNAMYQGLGQAGIGYANQSAADDRWNQGQDRADKRAKWQYGVDDDEE